MTGGVRIHLRQNGESHEPDLGVTPSHHRASIRHPARTADCAAFFYVETGLRRLSKHNPEARSYLRSTTKAIVTLYGFVLAVAFSLVIVDSGWAGLVYALGGAYIVVVMAEWTVHTRSIRALVHVRKLSPWLAWPMFLIPLAAPWLVDGWQPGLAALTVGLLLTLVLAFINTAGLLMLAGDFASYGEQIEARDGSHDG